MSDKICARRVVETLTVRGRVGDVAFVQMGRDMAIYLQAGVIIDTADMPLDRPLGVNSKGDIVFVCDLPIVPVKDTAHD